MGKVFKVLAVVAAVAVVVFAPVLAPVIGAALGVTSAVATAFLTAALTLGAGMALKALGVGAPKPSSQVGPPQVFRQSISNSFIIYGERRVGGLMVFFHARKSGDDHFRYFVIAHAGHHCSELVDWMLNDEVVTVDGSGKVTSGPYANACWLFFQNGDASETANATFVSECGGKWTTDHKGNGVCATYAKFEMTEDVVQAGMPNITAIIKGKDDIVDPRGPSTGYTNNAALVFYDYMATPREEGGFGAYDDEIPDDDWISAQANVCDETVNSESRYTINAVIQTGAPPSEIRDLLVVNQAGTYAYSGGKHLMRPGCWVPPSETFVEDDFSGPLQVSPFLPGDIAANEVQGTYISPDDNYQGMPFTTQRVASSDIRQLDLDLAFTTSPHQAERIASIMLKRAQCEKTVVAPLNIEGLRTKALDTIILNTSRYGLSNYAWVVTNWGLTADWNVVVTVREENEEVYDAPTPVAAPSVPAVEVPDPLGGPVDPGLLEDNAVDAVGALFADTSTIDFTYTANTSITADVKDDSVTYAKIQNVSATDRVLGRVSSGAGDVEEVTFTDQAQQLCDDTSFTAMLTTLGAPGLALSNSFTSTSGNSFLRTVSIPADAGANSTLSQRCGTGGTSALHDFRNADNSAGARILYGDTSAALRFDSGTTQIVRIDASGTRLTVHPTTASGANAFIDTGDNNYLKRSTSMRRFKSQIELVDPALADRVLTLEPVWYRSACAGDNPDWSWWGLVAEDVAKVDPRLCQWGYLPEDYFHRTKTARVKQPDGSVLKQVEKTRHLRKGAKLKPIGVDYSRLGVLLLSVSQRRFADIEQRLKNLESGAA